MEPPFDQLDGVLRTTSGYIGGTVTNPTYKQVTSGKTGHTEAIEVVYDSEKVSYDRLLEVFWENIDPLDPAGQFCDKGPQYRSGVFYLDEVQKASAEKSKKEISKKLGKEVVSEVTRATEFYPAEDYHQDYYKKNPVRYKYYRWGCGRDKRLKDLWGAEN